MPPPSPRAPSAADEDGPPEPQQPPPPKGLGLRILPCIPNVSPFTSGGGSGCSSGLATIGIPAKREPYYCGRWPGIGGTFAYTCAGCGRISRITPAIYWSLPELTNAELVHHGLVEKLFGSYTLGGRIKPAKAKELLLAGYTLKQVHAMFPEPRE